MLYYIIKFIKLVCMQPLQLAAHYAKVKREWENQRIAERVNQTVCVSFQYFNDCFVRHQVSSARCDKPYCLWKQQQRIIVHLDRALYSIDVAIYVMDSYSIGDALLRASKRGLRVRIICFKNYDILKSRYKDNLLLRRLTPETATKKLTMHHKFCVVDGYRAKRLAQVQKDSSLTIAMTGSMNWISLPRSCDDFYITSSPGIAKRLEQEFERIWKLAKG